MVQKGTVERSHKQIIEKSLNKIDDKLTSMINNVELELKLMNSEVQIDKILMIYEELSNNNLTFEEKYLFANYLINIFEQSNNILKKKLKIKNSYAMEHNLQYSTDIYDTFNVNKETLTNSLELLKSSDINNKVIGIDIFMALSHSNSTLLPELISILNGVTLLHEDVEDETQDYYFEWREKISNKIIKKLNEIRTQKGLSRFKYEDM